MFFYKPGVTITGGELLLGGGLTCGGGARRGGAERGSALAEQVGEVRGAGKAHGPIKGGGRDPRRRRAPVISAGLCAGKADRGNGLRVPGSGCCF